MSQNEFIEVPATTLSFNKRSLVCGVGINDSCYLTTRIDSNGKKIRCPYYRTWLSMISRCYSDKTKKARPTYIGCTVCDKWLVFTNFRAWMEKQDWKGKDLDKDLKILGNKIYSPELCLFVSSQINNLFSDSKASRGKLPIGVTFFRNRFVSQCSFKGVPKYLGTFLTAKEAHEAYRAFKRHLIEEAADLPENEYVRKYLLKRAELLKL